MFWRLRATELAGAVIERCHAEIQGEAGLAPEAFDGADLAGQLGARDGAVAGDRGKPTGDRGVAGNARDLMLQGLDLAAQLEDPHGVLADHVADQAGVGAKARVVLPSLDAIGLSRADGGQLEQAGAARLGPLAGELADLLGSGQKVQEPQVGGIAGDLQEPGPKGWMAPEDRFAWPRSPASVRRPGGAGAATAA